MQKVNAYVTIYSRTAQVRNILNITEPTKLLLPRSAELETIILLAGNGRIVPFNYTPAVTGVLTDRVSGERITATVTKDGKTIKGPVLSIDGDNITLLVNTAIIIIRHYDQVIFDTNDDNTKPYILINDSIGEVTVSYLLNNITWECVGTGLYDAKRNIIMLRLAATITNNSENNIEGQITIISGGVRQYREGTKEGIAIRASIYSPEVSQDNLEDYHEYNLGQRILYNKNVAELGTLEILANKIYIHETRSNNQVSYGFRMTASNFLPTATINMYTLENNTIGSYLGSNIIRETRKGEEVDIMIGSSTMIECETIITSVEHGLIQNNKDQENVNTSDIHSKPHFNIDTITTIVKNNSEEQLWLILKHFMGNKQFISSTQPINKITNDFIEWHVIVPAGQENIWTTIVETKQ